VPKALRTPAERFVNLPDFPWESRYVEVTADDGMALRLARIDEGPPNGHQVVLLHGEPTWSFLWRHVLPPLLRAGHHVIAPDQVGFGRSDKPARDWFSYERLYETMRQHLEAVLTDDPITLVVHDWGGPVGLRWAAEHPHLIARVIVLDTGLYRSGSQMGEAWWSFRNFVEKATSFPVAAMVDGACLTDLSEQVKAAYDAPFPDPSFHGGPLALPLLVPTSDDSPGAEEQMVAFAKIEAWIDIPIHLLWGAKDPIIPVKVGEALAKRWPSAHRAETVEGSHFLQEDAGPEIGRRIATWVATR
jgi:haloalkane dehalogenase